jgi:hypothetical protein
MPVKLGVSYFGNRFLSHAQHDLKRIAGCCDYVVHTVSESDLRFHKSALAKVFAETRRHKLEIWADPWGLGGVFGGEALSKFLIDHRDSWQVMSNGRLMPLACLNRPEWRSFVREWVLSVRDMGAQVILWDEPHIALDLESEMAGVFSCACAVCKDLFKKTYGEPMPLKLNDRAREFRRNSLKSFLTDVMAFSKTKELKNALCLYAFKGYKEYDQLWDGAAALADLDIFGCDPYWRWRGKHDPFTHVAEFSTRVVQSAELNKKQSQIWIQAMRLSSGAEVEIAPAISAALQTGVTHIAAWSYDGGELLDTVLAENPAEVWRVVEQSFLSIKEKTA